VPEANEPTYQLTGDQIVRQIALETALRQQLHGLNADNAKPVDALVDAADRIAGWLRG
jgi:hypothetical protein